MMPRRGWAWHDRAECLCWDGGERSRPKEWEPCPMRDDYRQCPVYRNSLRRSELSALLGLRDRYQGRRAQEIAE